MAKKVVKKAIPVTIEELTQVYPAPSINKVDELKLLIKQTIEKANEVMTEDRSRVLKLKSFVRTLADAERRLVV